MLPFSLEKGLLLEDRNILLPWGTSCQKLADLSSPAVTQAQSQILFAWQYPRCLDGLCGVVQARLTSKKNLREIELRVAAQTETAQQTFNRVSLHLQRAFGSPSRSEKSKFGGYPLEEWILPPITIWHMIAERFGEYHILHIRHRGKIQSDEE